MTDASAYAIAEVEREIAEMDAAVAAAEAELAQRHRRRGKVSSSFSIRLDTGELEALERRAAALGLKPSVLARNLIRSGLRGPADLDGARHLLAAVDRLEAEVADLRSLVT